MTKDDFEKWYQLREQIQNGWHMEASDKRELIRLNHLVMEAVNKIYNDHMMDKLW